MIVLVHGIGMSDMHESEQEASVGAATWAARSARSRQIGASGHWRAPSVAVAEHLWLGTATTHGNASRMTGTAAETRGFFHKR